MIIYQSRGQNIIRLRPFKCYNPKTEKQQIVRAKFLLALESYRKNQHLIPAEFRKYCAANRKNCSLIVRGHIAKCCINTDPITKKLYVDEKAVVGYILGLGRIKAE